MALERAAVEDRVRATVGDRRRQLSRYREPHGDPGWFGPQSVTWRVHSQLGPMLVGGMSALLLQSLHPLVVQGVADHSNYREDPFGRLQRTADFIAATTYGSSELASASVRRVRAIHARVEGSTPAGTAYRAERPGPAHVCACDGGVGFLAGVPAILGPSAASVGEEQIPARGGSRRAAASGPARCRRRPRTCGRTFVT